MLRSLRIPLYAALLSVCGSFIGGCAPGGGPGSESPAGGAGPDTVVRVALFNIWQLSTEKVDSVDAEGRGAHPQLLAAAEILRRVRADVVLLNEVDLARAGYGPDDDDLGAVVRRFVDRYLGQGADGLSYPHLVAEPSNTGALSGLDLNRDGVTAGPGDVGTRTHGDDAWGYGEYPGQYSMAVLSRFPVDRAGLRTFREFRWVDLPGHHLPTEFYGPVAERLRLSSKSHWDVPLVIGGDTLHLLASHPTPPGFDGEENRNGRRNFDEIRFWALYLDDDPALVDDDGRPGGLDAEAPFVIAGDLNAAPEGEGAALDGVPAIAQLLEHPRVHDPDALRGVPTTDFNGGRRIDYVLPSTGLEVVDAGVFGASPADSVDVALAAAASDHRLVWVDLRLPGGG